MPRTRHRHPLVRSLVTLVNVLLILLGFTLLIVVHELGHYLAARWAGIRVDGFAIGMGPHACSWRRGVGFVPGSTERVLWKRFGKQAIQMTELELARNGIGETEWSLRWLPIGGFVKMLGQDDMHPTTEATGPRSYVGAPIGKRMVVVSAGVIANAILAVILFMVAFLIGVRFEAPVIGGSFRDSPAAAAVATNAAALGITKPGLLAGDRVLTIDGDPARTFSDIQIAAAMGHPADTLKMVVERDGVAEPLRFEIEPRHDALMGVLAIGVEPAGSTTIAAQKPIAILVNAALDESGLAAQGVRGGMTMVEVNGQPVTTWQAMDERIAASGAREAITRWRTSDSANRPPDIEATMRLRPELVPMTVAPDPGAPPVAEGRRERVNGLFGLVPLVRIGAVAEDSRNRDVLRAGDVVLAIGPADAPAGEMIEAPRNNDFLRTVQARPGGSVALRVMRDGAPVDVVAKVNRSGQIGVSIAPAFDVPQVARPVERTEVEGVLQPSPIAGLFIGGGSTIVSMNGEPVADWIDVWNAMRAAAGDERALRDGVTVPFVVRGPGPDATERAVAMALSPADVSVVRSLRWRSPLDGLLFEPVSTLLTADGNPLRAVAMGMRETRKMVVMTYLTIVRLFQRTVGVEQLRGPVGIVHMGAAVVERGWTYGLFFLAMISVNLAVLNFLPLPIVDGGLFLYLVYEKVRGRPPSLAFQNAATLVGLCLIGTLFLVTFYNDVMRLVG